MGLIKNGREYPLSAKDFERLYSTFTRFPIAVSYSKKYKGKKNKRGKTYRPKSITIPYQNVRCKEPDYMGTWTYFETVTHNGDEKGTLTYGPHSLNFTNSYTAFGNSKETTNWELVFFLAFIHPGCWKYEKENLENQEYCKFMFDMPDREARDAISKTTDLIRVSNSILFQTETDQLRMAANALGKADAQTVTVDEVKQFLLEKIKEPKILKRYELLLGNAKAMSIYSVIQDGVKNRVFFFDSTTSRWYKGTASNKHAVPICDSSDRQDPQLSLYTYFMGNPTEYESFKNHINEVKGLPLQEHTVIKQRVDIPLPPPEQADERMPIGDLILDALELKVLKRGAGGLTYYGDTKLGNTKDIRVLLGKDNELRARIEGDVKAAAQLHVV